MRPILFGILGTAVLLSIYFGLISLISGWQFTLNQFSQSWYFIIALAIGFGIQVGLYSHLRGMVYHHSSGVIAISGTTSTVAMISCCAHYLVNILPIIGITGVISFVGQYQIEIFWLGLLSNVAGITYILSKIIKISKK